MAWADASAASSTWNNAEQIVLEGYIFGGYMTVGYFLPDWNYYKWDDVAETNDVWTEL